MQGFPKDFHEAITRSKETMDILDEFRQPTVTVTPKNQQQALSPIAMYSIYAVIFIAIAILLLYIRLKIKME